jgi:hypothetical protein
MIINLTMNKTFMYYASQDNEGIMATDSSCTRGLFHVPYEASGFEPML